MKVSDLKSKFALVNNGALDRSVSGLYTCDLLSHALGNIKKQDVVLFTILNSINIIAVASLLKLSAIVFCDGVYPSSDVIEKADEENICLFVSKHNSFESASMLK